LQIDSYDENGEFIGSDLAIFYEGAFTRLTNVSNGATASFGSNDPQFRTFIVQVDRGDGMDFLLVEILAQPIPEPSGAAILLLGLAIFPRLRRGLQAADRR
jgi:hypothetical protein